MAWTAADLPDLSGRTAVVTGANSGIGFQVVRALASRDAHVVLAVRDEDAGRAAARRIIGHAINGYEVRRLDLASMDSVRAFGDAWEGPLDLLVNNAGVMAPPRRATTADGFELQFGTNHLGHFVLTGLLLPSLSKPEGGGRVVTVSSITHHGGSRDVVDANANGPYNGQHAYANSKLANLLFALQLHRELTEHGSKVTSTAAHPGVSATGLFSSRDGMGANPLIRTLAPALTRVVTQPASAGARPVLYAATVAEPGSYSGPRLLGETRGRVGRARVSVLAGDEQLARRLWQVSEELTGFRYVWD